MKGQTLIEILVALGIIAVIVTALTAVVITSLGNTRHSKDQNLSLQYAQEGLEVVRSIRDENYNTFASLVDGSYCLAKNSRTLSTAVCSSANVDTYLRKVEIQNSGCSAGITRVKVTVSWQDSRCPQATPFCHDADLSTCLSAVNPVSGL